MRIDTIISRLIGCNRDNIRDKIKDQEIFLNDVIAKRASDNLEVGDIFSIRRYGKYKFKEVIGRTKKDNYI